MFITVIVNYVQLELYLLISYHVFHPTLVMSHTKISVMTKSQA